MKEVLIALAVFAVVGVGIVFGVRYRDHAREAADTRPSLVNFAPVNLPENTMNLDTSDTPDDSSENDAKPEAPVVSRPDAPETMMVKVLNGGAPGGSAGKMTAYLKSNGYAKAETGNANGSNIGIVIYYAADMADEVKPLQLLLLKQYKGVGAKPATEAKIPEAKTAPIVVVLGA